MVRESTSNSVECLISPPWLAVAEWNAIAPLKSNHESRKRTEP